jgi:hypothetical protein
VIDFAESFATISSMPDANLVKAQATDYCAVKALRDATRDQMEQFVPHLTNWAEKERNALLCLLNSYILCGRAFELALGALFRHEDPGEVPPAA